MYSLTRLYYLIILNIFSFCLLYFWQLARPTLIHAFTYQFALENNQIHLDYARIDLLTKATSAEKLTDKILLFNYQLTSQNSLPDDLPLLIAAFDQEVIFYADSAALNRGLLEGSIDLNKLDAAQSAQWPVFYQNSSISDLELQIKNLRFVDSFVQAKAVGGGISDLSAIKERDGQLTTIFSLQDSARNLHAYQLVCLDQQQKISRQIPLQQKHYLWSQYLFSQALPNHQEELIFQSTAPDCSNQVYILRDDGLVSNPVSIVAVQNL